MKKILPVFVLVSSFCFSYDFEDFPLPLPEQEYQEQVFSCLMIEDAVQRIEAMVYKSSVDSITRQNVLTQTALIKFSLGLVWLE